MRRDAVQMALQAIKEDAKQKAERAPLTHSILQKLAAPAVPPFLMESGPRESSDLMAANLRGLAPT